MDVTLGVAGALCVVLAVGHATLGIVWVLPGIDHERLPRTPFGSRRLTLATIRASWHIVTAFVLTLAGALLTLAWNQHADPETVVLRWFSAGWLIVAVVAIYAGLRDTRRIRDLMRLPVPVLFVVVSVLCWKAAG